MFKYQKENAHSILYLPTKVICFVAVMMKSYFLKALLILMHHFRACSYEEWCVHSSWLLARMSEGALVWSFGSLLTMVQCANQIYPSCEYFHFGYLHIPQMLCLFVLFSIVWWGMFFDSKVNVETELHGACLAEENQTAWQVSLPASVNALPHAAIANATPLAVFLLCHVTGSLVCELFY